VPSLEAAEVEILGPAELDSVLSCHFSLNMVRAFGHPPLRGNPNSLDRFSGAAVSSAGLPVTFGQKIMLYGTQV